MLRSYPAANSDAMLTPDCCWIDLIDPDEQERTIVQERFGIAVPTLETCHESTPAAAFTQTGASCE